MPIDLGLVDSMAENLVNDDRDPSEVEIDMARQWLLEYARLPGVWRTA